MPYAGCTAKTRRKMRKCRIMVGLGIFGKDMLGGETREGVEGLERGLSGIYDSGTVWFFI